MAPEVKDTTPSTDDLRKATALIAKDPLAIDRENARLFAADPANRSFEAQMYNKKIAEGTATPFEETLAEAYGERARAEVAAKEAPELEAAARYQKAIADRSSQTPPKTAGRSGAAKRGAVKAKGKRK